MFFLAGLAFDAIGRKTPPLRVTLLTLFGFVAGPFCLDIYPDITEAWFPVVAATALFEIVGPIATRAALRGADSG